GFVVDEFADAALALINLLQDLLNVGHAGGQLVVEGRVFDKHPDGSFAGVDAVDDGAGFANHGLGIVEHGLSLAAGELQGGDGAQGTVVECLVFDQFADRAVALGDLVGDEPDIGKGNAQVVSVLLHEIGNRTEQGTEL